MNTPPLHEQRCRPLSPADRLDPAAATALLASLDGWTVAEGRLQKTYTCADFAAAMAVAHRIARIADEQDHHPDLSIAWGRCTVRYHTHSAGGLTINDFICAARIDAPQV